MKTPVALIIFNRPEHTRCVFEAIRAARPEKLFVIADGARNEAEKEICTKTRAIIDTVDWPCVVEKNYSEHNLGCRDRVSSGITWVFERVEQAIILEDDCLPHPSFFPFCEDVLERYKDDERVMHISGNFFQQKNRRFKTTASYYTSAIPHIWGWATWRRAWQHYDVDLTQWPKLRDSGVMKEKFHNDAAFEYWERVWNQYCAGKIDSWDGQWVFACIAHDGLCINPTTNLVSNIGFGTQATHTKTSGSIFANTPTQEMTFPLTHPATLEINRHADVFTHRQNFGVDEKIRHRLLRPIKAVFPKQYWVVRNLFKKQ